MGMEMTTRGNGGQKMGAEKVPSKAIRTPFLEQQNFLTVGDSTYDFRYFTYAGAPAYPADNFL